MRALEVATTYMAKVESRSSKASTTSTITHSDIIEENTLCSLSPPPTWATRLPKMDMMASSHSKPSPPASDMTDVSVTKGEGVVANPSQPLFVCSLVQQPSHPKLQVVQNCTASTESDGGLDSSPLSSPLCTTDSVVHEDIPYPMLSAATCSVVCRNDPEVLTSITHFGLASPGLYPLPASESKQGDAYSCISNRVIDPSPSVMTSSHDPSPQNQLALVPRQSDALSSVVSTRISYPRIEDPPLPPPPLPIQLAMDENSYLLSAMFLRANNPLLLPPLTIRQGQFPPLWPQLQWLFGLWTAPGQKWPSPPTRIWFFWWKHRLRTFAFHFRIPKSLLQLLDYHSLGSSLYQRGA
jgi:hypothetical protein